VFVEAVLGLRILATTLIGETYIFEENVKM